MIFGIRTRPNSPLKDYAQYENYHLLLDKMGRHAITPCKTGG